MSRVTLELLHRGERGDRGRVVRLFPPFSQSGLDDEGARPHPRAALVTDELTVDNAQGGENPGSTVVGRTLFRFGWGMASTVAPNGHG